VAHQLSGRQTMAAATLLKRDRTLPVDTAVAQVREPGGTAPSPPVAAAPAEPYPAVLDHVQGALAAIQGAGGTDGPLTTAQVRELVAALEPLVGLYEHLAWVVASLETGQAVRSLRLSDLAARRRRGAGPATGGRGS